MSLITYAKAPTLKIIPKEHFWVSGLKRAFELSALIPLYIYVNDNINSLPKEKDLEFTIGSSTLIYQISKSNQIQLITGWTGSRK